MTMWTRSISAIAVLAGCAALAAPAALAQDRPVTLRFAHWVPAQHPIGPGIELWGKSLSDATNGTLKVQIFPAQQLGQAKDHYDMARDGIADVAFVNPGYQPGRFPVVGAAELPFMFSNAKGGSAAIDAWYRKYGEKEMSEVKLCLTHLHSPGTFHGKVKVVAPEDVKGLKVRSANATIGRLVTHLGGTNVQVSAPESREAVERGVADVITFPWDSILLFGIDKAAKQHLDAPLYATVFNWVMNKGVYDKLSATQKKAIDDHCTSEWAEKVATRWADQEDSGREKIKAMSDHTVTVPTPAQLDAWRKAAEPLTKDWAKDVTAKGLNPDAIMGELQAEIKKRNAAAM